VLQPLVGSADEANARRAEYTDPTTDLAQLVVAAVVESLCHVGAVPAGYGSVAGAPAEKALPAGSFYTEPSGVAHLAKTNANPVVVYITGSGPTDTVYLK
jgi:hypothetical protein